MNECRAQARAVLFLVHSFSLSRGSSPVNEEESAELTSLHAVCSRTEIVMVLRAFRKASFFSLTTIVWALSLSATANADKIDSREFCPDQVSVDLTHRARNATGISLRPEHFFPTEFVRRENGEWRGCICDIKPCVALCLPLKDANGKILGPEYFHNIRAKLPPVYTTNLTLEVFGNPLPDLEEWFHVLYWDPCMGGPAYYLEPDTFKTDEWYLLKNGSLFLSHRNDTSPFFNWRQYCFRQKRNQTIYTPRVCSPKPQTDPLRTASYIGGLVSVPFLIVTIFVYSVLPELRNIHGNTFRCYLCCLLATYITLAADRIPPSADNIGTLCLTLGFLIYFAFVATFLWLNVMCFDMWWRFGGFGCRRSGGRQQDGKTFIRYSIYAWGTATILTVICISLEFAPVFQQSLIKPGFTHRSCWFSTKVAAALFFFGPMGVTIVCNIYFFVATLIKLIQQQRGCSDDRSHDENRLMFSLYSKLFIVMGLSWSTEIISGLWDTPKYVWYFTDMVNALQGILIFAIFICKKKIWRSLQNRFKCYPRCSRKGCTFTKPNTDSGAISSSTDNFIVRPNNSMALNAQANTSPVD